MKTLQINCVFAIGSTGKIVEDMSNYCISKGDEVLILYGRQAVNAGHNVVKVSSEFEAKLHSVMSRLTGQDFSYSYIATQKAIRVIKEFCPDVVHLHCLNGHYVNVYCLLEFLKKKQIPTVLTLHAEIMHTAGCEHAYECMKWVTGCHGCDRIRGKVTHYFRDDAKMAYFKMEKAFHGFKKLSIVGVSDWLTNRARQSAVFQHCDANFFTIENGLDLTAFHYIPKSKNPIVDELKDDFPVILHVTPNFLHPLKGGRYVVKLAKMHPEWQFVIVGYNGSEELPINVKTVEHTNSKEELSWYYNIADVTLLTSKRETFSMVCAESLACGTPVVGFKAGGPECVFKGDFAQFVDYGNVEALSKAVSLMLVNNPIINSSLICRRFSSKEMAKKYYSVYTETMRA